MPRDNPMHDGASVATDALAQLADQIQGWDMRRKQLGYPPDPHTLGPTSREQFDRNRLPIEEVRRAMTRPLRLVLTFDDPYAVREQLKALAPAILQALAISQDVNGRNGYRQCADMRNVLREAGREIAALQGKKSDPR